METRPVITSPQPEWIEIIGAVRPYGKCLLLTCEGVAVIGEYDGNSDHYLAFFALPKIPDTIKIRLHGNTNRQEGDRNG